MNIIIEGNIVIKVINRDIGNANNSLVVFDNISWTPYETGPVLPFEKEILKEDIILYPNQTSSILNFKNNVAIDITSAILINPTRKVLVNNTNGSSINNSNLSKRIYLLKIVT